MCAIFFGMPFGRTLIFLMMNIGIIQAAQCLLFGLPPQTGVLLQTKHATRLCYKRVGNNEIESET